MSDESFVEASRREFAAALSALAGSSALAGCTGSLTNQEFEADPVGLGDDAVQGLAMEELTTDSHTITREGDVAGVDGEISITSYLASYGRSLELVDEQSGYRPTVVDSFVRERDSREAVVLAGGNEFFPDSIEQIRPIEEEVTVEPDQVTVLAPTGARSDGSVEAVDVLGIVRPAPTADEVTLETNGYLVPPGGFFPAGVVPAGWSDWTPVNSVVFQNWPGPNLDVDPETFVDEGRVLVTPAENFNTLGGAYWDSVEEVEAGQTISTEQTLIAGALGDVMVVPAGWSDWEPAEVFAGCRPIPSGGVGFGLGVLSTPDAQIDDESVNPLAQMDDQELLNSDRVTSMLDTPYYQTDEGGVEVVREFGVVPAGWSEKRGVVPAGWSERRGDVLGEEAPFETYAGVVEDDSGPWLTVAHIARASPDDLVIAVGTHATPLGEMPPADWSPREMTTQWPLWDAAAGRLFSVDSTGRLESMPPADWE